MNNVLNYRKELYFYITGFVLSLVLTFIPFGLVVWSDWPVYSILIGVGICALIQIFVHFRFFLHIDLSKEKREDLYLLLFSLILLIIMAGGTIWILWSLHIRMM